MPTLLYGCETWNSLTQSDCRMINQSQHYIAKSIQGYPKLTRSDMCESMIGLFPLCSIVEKRKLVFLHKLLTLPAAALSRQILLTRYFQYIYAPSNRRKTFRGFIPDICCLLIKYKLQWIINDFVSHNSLPSKISWKKHVNKTVESHQKQL